MDFFGKQQKARRASWLLAVLFLLATACVIVACYVVVTVALGLYVHTFMPRAPLLYWHPTLFLMTTTVIGGLILLASLIKTVTLIQGGGEAIANGLDGRHIPRSTTDPDERQLINVLDEMAIAAGMPAVPVFVLDDENGINAFAAGSDLDDAVIAVTRGALKELTRDELQALIGHEISHIINGDTRLNFWMIGILHGILLMYLLGRLALGASLRYGKYDPFRITAFGVVVGAALTIIGFLGHLLAESIKALMCRHNEYAADAAAVQYTRNPDAVVSLLEKIALRGSCIRHPLVEQASHILIAPARNQWRGAPTHPPLLERIKQIEPGFDETSLPNPGPHIPDEFKDGYTLTPADFVARAGQSGPQHLEHARTLLNTLPAALLQATRHIDGARQCIAALLLSPDDQVRARQSSLIEQAHGESFMLETAKYADWIAAEGSHYRLPVLDLALPTLAELPFSDKRKLMTLCDALIHADAHTSIFEQVVRRLLRTHLPSFDRSPATRVSKDKLAQDITTLLSALIQSDALSREQQTAAFAQAVGYINLDGPWQLPTTPPDAASLNDALDHIASNYFALRKQVLEACVAAAMHDQTISASEAEVLRAIAQALGCPVPPYLRYASSLQNQKKTHPD